MMPFSTIGTPGLWIGFVAVVVVMLIVDLGVFHRKAHAVSIREASIWTVVWIALAALFNVAVYFWFGADRALEFTTGYLIEKALAVDNIFVFVVVFGAFAIAPAYQHRVLFWGVLGALVMRAGFIVVGGALLQRFHWATYLFGTLLLATGIKLLLERHRPIHPERNVVVRALRRLMPITDEAEGRFLVRREGRLHATSLLLALVTVEFVDLVFAVDSIPAIFAVTEDPFIVFTSNVFAIFGLRSLYFLVAGVVTRFVHLKVGLSVVVVFVGVKMLLTDVYQLPIAASLLVILGILATSIATSLRAEARQRDGARRGAARVRSALP